MVMRKLCNKVPRHLYIGLVLALVLWAWNLFKLVEPQVLPVVSGFAIVDVDRDQAGEVWIRGTMTKVRDCEFTQIAAYSGPTLLDLHYTETREQVSRIPGAQTWGWWTLTPDVNALSLYADHECITGRVRTKLFDGVIK